MDEVLDRLKELGGLPSLSSMDKQEIEELYGKVLGKKFRRTSCNDCYKDATIEMYNFLKKNGKMKEETEYRLKNGVLLQMGFGDTNFYTNESLTDEVAETYLSKHPESIKWFSKYPGDWEERVNGKKRNASARKKRRI